MLTRTTQYLSAIRGFISHPFVCTAEFSLFPRVFILQWSNHAFRGTRTRLYSIGETQPKGVPLEDGKPPIPVPYALRGAAKAFQEQIRRGDLFFVAESYMFLREVIIASNRHGLMALNDHELPRLLRFPEVVLRDAMVLLTTSRQREHAKLHLMMFDDLTSVFRTSVTLDPPLEFTAKMLHTYLKSRKSDMLECVYDHLCHLCDAAPPSLDNYVSDINVWTAFIRRLADVPREEHAKLLPRILHDLPRLYNIQPTATHHHCVIKSFLDAAMLADAWKWLLRMEQFADMPVPSAEKLTWSSRLHGFWNRAPLSAPTIWAQPRSEEYDLILRYLAVRGDFKAARSVMTHMAAAGPDAAPTRRSWHMFLSAALADPKSDESQVGAVIEELEQTGHSVHLRTLRLISARGTLPTWVSQGKYDIIRAAAARSKQERVAIHTTPYPVGKQSNASGLDTDAATPLEQDISPTAARLDGPSTLPGDWVNAGPSAESTLALRGSYTSRTKDVKDVDESRSPTTSLSLTDPDETGRREADSGNIPWGSGLENSAVAADASSAFKPGKGKYKCDEAFLRSLKGQIFDGVQRGDMHHALKYYAELTELTRTDLEVADALIRALCWGSLQAPPKSRILQALRIYRDLIEGEQKNADGTKRFSDGVKPPSVQEQHLYTRIYNTLLRALSTPAFLKASLRDSNPELQAQYTTYAMELLKDMEARGIRPNDRTISSILLLRFRGAKNHQEAFEYYRSMLKDLETTAARVFTKLDGGSDPQPSGSSKPPLLNLAGYRAVLNAFGKLSFPDAPVAPASLWFSIAKDMRARGHVVTAADYTIFLSSILAQKTAPFALQRAALGLPSAEGLAERIKAMTASTIYLHKQLTIDVHVSPDAALLNTLMNVYQHLGAFDNALKVFNTIWISGRMDDATPVIIFDACGYARRHREATTIWCMLIEKGWRFDKHTLDTWVECLCRLGDVETATNFVCMHMGREQGGYLSKGDTQPDTQTCLILLKMSWAVGQNAAVKERVRKYLPYIWNKLTPHYT